jgi:hypothetical protein
MRTAAGSINHTCRLGISNQYTILNVARQCNEIAVDGTVSQRFVADRVGLLIGSDEEKW